ncbi:hypothetical protein MRB53_006503 [Persea americana]|uniref:Uncharacterized protein n=1 Tax=Persea americana TaxID=3435 RepID=A0ACC2MGE4_PERAE|nr:hypothetical protein MRB53_006503 [Persea americana]
MNIVAANLSDHVSVAYVHGLLLNMEMRIAHHRSSSSKPSDQNTVALFTPENGTNTSYGHGCGRQGRGRGCSQQGGRGSPQSQGSNKSNNVASPSSNHRPPRTTCQILETNMMPTVQQQAYVISNVLPPHLASSTEAKHVEEHELLQTLQQDPFQDAVRFITSRTNAQPVTIHDENESPGIDQRVACRPSVHTQPPVASHPSMPSKQTHICHPTLPTEPIARPVPPAHPMVTHSMDGTHKNKIHSVTRLPLHAALTIRTSPIESTSFTMAVKSPEWHTAMALESNALQSNGTWFRPLSGKA